MASKKSKVEDKASEKAEDKPEKPVDEECRVQFLVGYWQGKKHFARGVCMTTGKVVDAIGKDEVDRLLKQKGLRVV